MGGGRHPASLHTPNPVALHAQPPPGSPFLDLSQPVLLGHHLPPLSLHMAREGPQDVALLVSMGLWDQDRKLSWVLPHLPSLGPTQPPLLIAFV